MAPVSLDYSLAETCLVARRLQLVVSAGQPQKGRRGHRISLNGIATPASSPVPSAVLKPIFSATSRD